MSRWRVRWLGRLPYAEAWDLQRAFWEGRVSGRSRDDYLLLLEHPPTYTVGRNGDGSNVLVDAADRTRLGIEMYDVDRGGDVTFHGPGQLVGYPIVDLGPEPDVVAYVRRMERALIAALGDLGVEARAEPGYTGVWTERGKIAAIGVKVSRGVTMHGFALNVDPDLGYYEHIVPCGIADRPVTSVAAVTGAAPGMAAAVDAVAAGFAAEFGADPEIQLSAFARGAGRRFDIDRMVADGVFSAEQRAREPVLVDGRLPGEPVRPDWMRVTADQASAGFAGTRGLMDELGLNTVCVAAGCPNIYECWGQGTATLMLLGDVCTRACAFCDVTTGKPGPVDDTEPVRAAAAVARMELEHAVLTSVDRDDLADGGAGVFAATIRAIRAAAPTCRVEVLIPDFKGNPTALKTVLDASPEVLNHNIETVLRLQREVRTAASYGRSLALLARAKQHDPAAAVKSGIIVGMGETEAEVHGTLADLRAVGVDIVTIGQYLRPTARHRPVARYAPPEEFARYAAAGGGLGFARVESGPLVRSSYHARDSLTTVTR
jgi:lipoic acid synthetase